MNGLSKCHGCGQYLIDEEVPIHSCHSEIQDIECEHWIDGIKYGVNLLIVRTISGRLYRFKLADKINRVQQPGSTTEKPTESNRQRNRTLPEALLHPQLLHSIVTGQRSRLQSKFFKFQNQ